MPIPPLRRGVSNTSRAVIVPGSTIGSGGEIPPSTEDEDDESSKSSNDMTRWERAENKATMLIWMCGVTLSR